MTESTKAKGRLILTDLPPELWGHITTYLPKASHIANLSRTSKILHEYVEKDGWKVFSRARFPSLYSADAPQYTEAARSWTSLSRAWERRALVARGLKIDGDIISYPGKKRVESWRAPGGQTIGFSPRMDVYEEVGPRWKDRKEIFAFSAGSEVCIRQTETNVDARWTTYRPASAREGRDDVTTLNLLKPYETSQQAKQRLIVGTAKGELRLVGLPTPDSPDVDADEVHFDTQDLSVRSGSLFQQAGQPRLFVASLGDKKIALYPVDTEQTTTISPLTDIDIHPPLQEDGNPFRYHRVWSTTFLSSNVLAVGTGGSNESIHLYSVTPTGLSRQPFRKYSLQTSQTSILANPRRTPQASSTYCIVPIPNTSTPGQLFLSGSYNGIIRLHDQRSPAPQSQTYLDDADDPPIYSLLPRGQEKFLAGTGRHNLVKIFDLRLGSKRYSYLSSSSPSTDSSSPAPSSAASDQPLPPRRQMRSFKRTGDFNLYLRDHTRSLPPNPIGPGHPSSSTRFFNNNLPVWNRPHQGGRRAAGGGSSLKESSVYSLASAREDSPCIYAGVEGGVISVGVVEVLDPRPDEAYFTAGGFMRGGKKGERDGGHDVMNLAMYERGEEGGSMRLWVQRRVEELSVGKEGEGEEGGELDERWRDSALER